MKVRVPSYFDEFKCIAEKCEDTCCAGWGIVIDDKTFNRYKNVNSDFGMVLRNRIVRDHGENVFLLNNGNCSFLNKDKLCDIYSNLGEDYLCHTCKEYPRYTEEFLDLKEVGISLSCPEAARIILKSGENFSFKVRENLEKHDLESDMDEDVLLDFLNCREVVFDILEKEGLDLNIKIAIILKFVKEVQDKIDLGDMDEIACVIEEYKNKKFLHRIIKGLSIYKDKNRTRYNNIYEYFKVYKDINHINENDPLALEKSLKYFKENKEKLTYIHKEFNDYYKESLYKFKNILVYFIFRYLMKAIFDYDISAKIKLAIISTLMIKELSIVRWMEKGNFTEEDLVDIAHTYSKDIEHSDENIETLQEIFETDEIFEGDEILDVLFNIF
ncbi:MAG: flagellin lysine-N-methylase [Clostridium perfringens]|nr:flagellin lysine-N-methylase [Clostridium perfringens]